MFPEDSNGFKDYCIDRMEHSVGRRFMHSFGSKRPRVPTFLVCLVSVNAVKSLHIVKAHVT